MNNMEEELIWLRAQDTIRTIQIRMDEEDDKRSGSELDKRLEVLKKEKKIEELIKANFGLSLIFIMMLVIELVSFLKHYR